VIVGIGLDQMPLADWEKLSDAAKQMRFQDKWQRTMTLGIKEVRLTDVRKRLPVTIGHEALAAMLAEGYFRIIVTSTWDSLVEEALIRARMPKHSFRILVNGLHDQEEILDVIDEARHPIILKLCGDPDLQRNGPVVSNGGLEASSLKRLWAKLRKYPFVLVGYSYLDDLLSHDLPKQDELVYNIAAAAPPGDSGFYQRFPSPPRVDVFDEKMNFNRFCTTLAERLEVLRKVEAYGAGPVTEELLKRMPAGAPAPEFLIQLIEDNPPTTNGPDLVALTRYIFHIRLDGERRVSFEVEGSVRQRGSAPQPWDIDIADLNVEVQDLGMKIAAFHQLQNVDVRNTWRRDAKRQGRSLYDRLLQSYPELQSQLETVQGLVNAEPENLTFSFEGGRACLGIPFELLHDGNIWLSTKYPLSRKVLGARSNGIVFRSLVNSLKNRKEVLRVLLIASNPGGLSVDDEVAALKTQIESLAAAVYLRCEIDLVPTAKATLQYAATLFEKCAHHVVHFAGHGRINSDSPEESGIYFFEGENRSGELKVLSARKLAELIGKGSQTSLFYLSSCLGAWGGRQEQLRDDDYLGVMDALVQSGVQYVLGYRWYVTDSGSQRFAKQFYASLLKQPHSPELAALHARAKIYGDSGDDETWTSPILVAQNLLR
jgi:CHAT domain-containing protein